MFGFLKPKQNIVVLDCSRQCTKDKCPKWVILNQNIIDPEGNKKVIPEGKCAIAWIPTLMIELLRKP